MIIFTQIYNELTIEATNRSKKPVKKELGYLRLEEIINVFSFDIGKSLSYSLLRIGSNLILDSDKHIFSYQLVIYLKTSEHYMYPIFKLCGFFL